LTGFAVIRQAGRRGATRRMYHCGIAASFNSIGISMNFIPRLLCGIALSAVMMSAVMAAEAKVVSSINTMSYTFIEIFRDDKTQWLATDVTRLKPGDRIQYEEGFLMLNFRSNDLERTFPNMTFIEKLKVIREK